MLEGEFGGAAVPVEVRAFHGAVMREVMGGLSALTQRNELTPAQISALFRVRAAGSLTLSEIGTGLGLTSGTTSHLVDRLVRRGLLVRTESVPDRRHRHVALTPDGVEFLEVVERGLGEGLARLLRPVPDGVLRELSVVLRRVLDHV